MKKHTIRVAAVAAVTLVAGSLVACSSGGGSSDGTTLTVYGWKGSETEPANVPEINAAFEAANPGVTVNYEFLNNGDVINQRLQPELLAGEGPDVFMTDRSAIEAAVGNDYLLDLSDQPWANTISEQVAPYVTFDGTVYGAPLELLPIGLYANMDILAEAGITEFPTTHAAFIDALTALKTAGKPGLAVPNKGTWTDGAIMNGAASTLVYGENPSWDEDFLAGEVGFSDWKSSVEQILDLGDAGLVDLAEGLGIDEWSQGLEDFKAGKSAFLYQGGWNLADFQQSVPSLQFGPWPASDSGPQHATLFSGLNWVVNKASDNQDLAKKYIEFFVSEAQLSGFLAAEAGLTPYTDGSSPEIPAAALIADAVEAGNFRLDASTTWETLDNITTYSEDLQALILGSATTDEVLQQWDSFRDGTTQP